ncbi:MAG: NAD(P)-binding domain-containing protein, partial [Tannerella sp.]|nr:NAD(P)-binding domain-containing protein [Tannerella sp.]
MKVTIIGAGNMGGAIACGLAEGSLIRTNEIICADFSQEALEKIRVKHPDIRMTRNNREA